MTMSEDTGKTEKFQLILECMERQAIALEENRDALIIMNRRMDSHGSYLKGIVESMQTLAKRQADLEALSDRRRTNCSEIMQTMIDRITALENERTPLPKSFTPDELESMYVTGSMVERVGRNGSSGLPLMAASDCGENVVADDDDSESD